NLIRSLGNLVILYAQTEAELIELLTRMPKVKRGDNQHAPICAPPQDEAADMAQFDTVGEAQKLLAQPLKAQQEIIDRAQELGDPRFEELSEKIGDYFSDRQLRNRLIHDEWDVSILECDAGWRVEPITRGIPRKTPSDVVWGEPKPDDVWKLALRFRDHRSLFVSLSRVLRDKTAPNADPRTPK